MGSNDLQFGDATVIRREGAGQMANENLRAEVEWLAAKLAVSEVRYERGPATRLQQFLEISPEVRHNFARTHFSNADLSWFQGGMNAADALATEEYGGERIDFGADTRRARAIVRNLLEYMRSDG
jgi:hypothetical protein